METNKDLEVEILNPALKNGCTYAFKSAQDMDVQRSRRKIWQILPSVCGSMICVPYGMMLGWPSPTYPNLLKPTSDVPITIDQSAMIAGFLMIGVSIATPVSSRRTFDSKYGICIAAVFITVGWITMWRATNIYFLLTSRLVTGAGYGYGLGQLKLYVSEMCEEQTAKRFVGKYLQLNLFLGVILAFAVGPFVDFKKFGIISVIVAIFVLFLTIFLPSTPRELVKNNKTFDALKLIGFLKPQVNAKEEILKIKQTINNPPEELSIIQILKIENLRNNFIKFAILVFFQQFSGAPSTIIYCQILFQAAGNPHPEFCAMIYVSVFTLSYVYGMFYPLGSNKRLHLLASSIGISVILLLQVFAIYYELNQTLWQFSTLLVMSLYIIFHTIGLGNVPILMINDFFEEDARKVVTHFYIIFHSILALLITKIFQVLYDTQGIITPFCLYFIVSIISITFVTFCLRNK